MATAMLTLARAVSLPMLMFGLREGRRGGQRQDGYGYQQAAHGLLPEKCPQRDNAVTGDGGSGSLIPPPWPMVVP
jgi:hypothetical protein